jgi:hypothetical protein
VRLRVRRGEVATRPGGDDQFAELLHFVTLEVVARLVPEALSVPSSNLAASRIMFSHNLMRG